MLTAHSVSILIDVGIEDATPNFPFSTWPTFSREVEVPPCQKSEAHRSGQELTHVDGPLLHARDEGHRDVGSTDLFAEVQDEQLRMFESMDHFMYHVRLQLDRHRKEVEMHQFRQLGLLRGISEAGFSNADVIRRGDVGRASPQAASIRYSSVRFQGSLGDGCGGCASFYSWSSYSVSVCEGACVSVEEWECAGLVGRSDPGAGLAKLRNPTFDHRERQYLVDQCESSMTCRNSLKVR